jgi:hypothetical protein
MIIVERAQPLPGLSGRANGQVAADDFDDVVGLLDLLDTVVYQGPPVATSQWIKHPEETAPAGCDSFAISSPSS